MQENFNKGVRQGDKVFPELLMSCLEVVFKTGEEEDPQKYRQRVSEAICPQAYAPH